jgi:O-antigen ligase
MWMWFGTSLLWTADILLGWAKLVELTVAVALAATTGIVLRERRDAMAFALGFAAVITILAVGSLVRIESWALGSRAAAFGGGPNVFGRLMFAGLASLWFIATVHALPRWARLPAGLLTVVSVVLLFAAGSRGVLVASVGSIVTVWLLGSLSRRRRPIPRRRRGRPLLAKGLSLGLALGALVWIGGRVVASSVLRRYAVFFIEGRAEGARWGLLADAVSRFAHHPWIGTGLGSFQLGSILHYPHNWFAELAAEGGTVALVLGLLFCLAVTVDLVYLIAKDTQLGTYLGHLFVFSLLASQFSGDLFDSRIVLVYGVAIAAMAHRWRMGAIGSQGTQRATMAVQSDASER